MSANEANPPLAAADHEVSYPALYYSYDAASGRSQRLFFRLTWMSLGGLVVAAVASALSIGEDPDWGPVIALIALLAAVICRSLLFQQEPQRSWYDGRAGAESVKTLAWLYAVGGRPFTIDRANGDGPARGALAERLSALMGHPGLGGAAAPGSRQITDWMDRMRGLPIRERRSAYAHGRLEEQIAWYDAGSVRHERSSRRWSLAVIGLQCLGIVAAVLQATGVVDFNYVGVATAVAAAAIAWLESKDHAQLSEAYSTTAHELRLVLDQLIDDDDEERWATGVADAEAAISREHTSWLARRRARQTGTSLL